MYKLLLILSFGFKSGICHLIAPVHVHCFSITVNAFQKRVLKILPGTIHCCIKLDECHLAKYQFELIKYSEIKAVNKTHFFRKPCISRNKAYQLLAFETANFLKRKIM